MHAVAREQYVKCGKDLAHHLRNLEILKKEWDDSAMMKRIAIENARLATTQKPRRYIKEIEEEFLPQFMEGELLRRRKFLVLDGDSGLGKTVCAQTLATSTEHFLEVNCATCAEPPLRDYNCNQHEVVFFDEVKPQMVIKQKRLYQAPNVFITLGCSPTNKDTYKVYMYGTKIVLASNTWEHDVNHLENPQDRDWLRKNQVYIKVTEPLWQV